MLPRTSPKLEGKQRTTREAFGWFCNKTVRDILTQGLRAAYEAIAVLESHVKVTEPAYAESQRETWI